MALEASYSPVSRDERQDVVQRLLHFLVLADLVFQTLGFLQNLLGVFQIGVEIGILHLLLQFVEALLCLFDAQNLVQLLEIFAVITHGDAQFV